MAENYVTEITDDRIAWQLQRGLGGHIEPAPACAADNGPSPGVICLPLSDEQAAWVLRVLSEQVRQ